MKPSILIFKKLAQNIGNFKNIAVTLAKCHQYLQCYYSMNKESLMQENPEIGPGIPVSVRDQPLLLQDDSTDCYRYV